MPSSNFKSFTKDDKLFIVKSYVSGSSINSIARSFDCSRQPIKTVLKHANIPIRGSAEQRALDTKKYYQSLLLQSDILLSNGSVIYHSKPRKNINGTWCVLIKCGDCSKTRYIQLNTTRQSSFSGLCIPCSNKFMFTNKQIGNKHPSWSGGQTSSKEGYVYRHSCLYTKDELKILSPMLTKSGYILEHRAVMALSIKRPLVKSEHVHHLNGIKHDNRLCNLRLTTPQNHPALETNRYRFLQREIKRLQSLLDIADTIY